MVLYRIQRQLAEFNKEHCQGSPLFKKHLSLPVQKYLLIVKDPLPPFHSCASSSCRCAPTQLLKAGLGFFHLLAWGFGLGLVWGFLFGFFGFPFGGRVGVFLFLFCF